MLERKMVSIDKNDHRELKYISVSTDKSMTELLKEAIQL